MNKRRKRRSICLKCRTFLRRSSSKIDYIKKWRIKRKKKGKSSKEGKRKKEEKEEDWKNWRLKDRPEDLQYPQNRHKDN